jgi:hypothetical protein
MQPSGSESRQKRPYGKFKRAARGHHLTHQFLPLCRTRSVLRQFVVEYRGSSLPRLSAPPAASYLNGPDAMLRSV